MAPNGPQTARKSQSLFLVHRNLRNAPHLILDGVLNRDDLVFVVLNLVNGRVERRGFSGAGRPGYENHAVGFVNITAETRHVLLVEANYIQREVMKLFAERLFVQNAE